MSSLLQVSRPREAISRQKTGLLWRLGALEDRELVRRFETWRSQDLWLYFSKQGEGGVAFSRSLAPKRGNEVYSFQLRERLSRLATVASLQLRVNSHSTNAVFLTLTYARKGMRGEAWLRTGERWNLFLANLRKRFGRIEFVRSWESHKDGWPHVHALVVFKDHDFKTQLRWSASKKRMVSRVVGASRIKGYWPHGHVDVEGCETTEGAVYYITKEVVKYGITLQEGKGALTMAACWALGRRSIGVSRGLAEDAKRRLDAPPGVSLTQTWKFEGIRDREPFEAKNPWVQEVDMLPPDLRRPLKKGEREPDGTQHEVFARGDPLTGTRFTVLRYKIGDVWRERWEPEIVYDEWKARGWRPD